MRLSSWRSSSSSSLLRVPERLMSLAGKTRIGRRASVEVPSMFPVP